MKSALTILTKVLLSTISVVALSGAAQAADPAPAAVVTNILDGADPGKVSVAGITVYGTIDVGMVYNSHAANRDTIGSNYIGQPYVIQNSSQRSNFTYQNNALSQSNVGIKGSQKLDDITGISGLKGWSIGFQGQIDFDPLYGQIGDILKAEARNNGLNNNQRSFAADGSKAGQLFSNQAFASLKNDVLGELRFGRNNSLLLDQISAYEPQASSYALSPLGFSGTIGGGAGSTEDSRWNNSLKYVNTIGPVRVGAAYRFSGGGQGDDAWAISAGIDAPGALKGLSVDGSYTQENSTITTGILSTAQCTAAFGTVGACQSSNVLTGTVQDTEAWAVTAKYKFNEDSFAKGLVIMSGFERIENSNASTRLPSNNAIGGYQLLNLPGTANVPNYTAFATPRDLDVFWIGGRYNFTPKLVGGIAYYRQHQEEFVASNALGAQTVCNHARGTTASSNCGGDLNFYSLSLDYQVTKRVDLYAGASWSDVAGGSANGFLSTNEYNLVSGLRFRF